MVQSRRTLLIFCAAFALVGGPVVVRAQGITYLPERGVGVSDRARPDYDPIGIRADDLTLYPAVDVSGVYTDNFRATDDNKLSDFYAVVRPNVRATTNWSRNAVDINAYYSRPFHAKLTQENVGQYGGNALGRLDISRDTTLQLNVGGQRGVESRTEIGSFRGSADPVQFTSADLSLSASHSAGDFQFNGAAGISRRDFSDVRGNNGVIIDQDFRDYRSVFGNASASYRVGPGVSVVISGQVDKNTYGFGPGSLGFDPVNSIDRQSTGYTIQGGANLELSSLIFGTLQVGLIRRNYVDPRLTDFSGLSVTAQLLWNITPLTTIRLDAARTVEDTASLLVAGNLRTRVGLTVDHELFRYIILTGDTVYSHIKPNGPLASSDEFAAGLGARYLMNRQITVTGSLRHAQRTSDFSQFRFHANTISAGVRYAF